MPAQKRVRGHDQPLSAPVREQAGERRDEGTVGGPQGRAATLPAEHDELMSEHEQLDVFGELAAPASDKQPQNSREREIGEGEEHPPILPEPTTRGSQTRNSFETPQAELLVAVRPRWPRRRRRRSDRRPAARTLATKTENRVPAWVSSRHLPRSSQNRFRHQSSSLGGSFASERCPSSRLSARRVQRSTTGRT